jgi:hypothetical protein
VILTNDELAAIRARVEAATPGPWRTHIYPMGESTIYGVGTCGAGPEDLAFIAAARTDVPDLLAEVERLRAELAAVRAYYSDDASEARMAAWRADPDGEHQE